MKKIILLLLLSISFIACNCKKEEKGCGTACACSKPKLETSSDQFRHVVLFEWVDSITPEKKTELINHFGSLKSKIEAIKDFEYGSDASVEGLTKGYTDCFIVTFENAEGRDTYLPHADHKIFGEAVVPYLKNVLVIDYEVKK